MSTPAPEAPWYQFTLRSLLLFTFFVAVLCSISVCTHWMFPAIIVETVIVGGLAGTIAAGSRVGFTQGVLGTIPFFLIAVVSSIPLTCTDPFYWSTPWRLRLPLPLHSRSLSSSVRRGTLGGSISGLTP